MFIFFSWVLRVSKIISLILILANQVEEVVAEDLEKLLEKQHWHDILKYEPRHEKTCLRGLRPVETQTACSADETS